MKLARNIGDLTKLKSYNEFTPEQLKSMPPVPSYFIEYDMTDNLLWDGTDWVNTQSN